MKVLVVRKGDLSSIFHWWKNRSRIGMFDMPVLIQRMCFSCFSFLFLPEGEKKNHNIMIITCGGGGGAHAGPRLEKGSTPSQPLSERMRLLLKYAVGQNGLFKDTANKLRHVMSIKAQVWSWQRSSFFPPSSSSFQAWRIKTKKVLLLGESRGVCVWAE